MNIEQIVYDIEDLCLDLKDDGFNVTLSADHNQLKQYEQYEIFISYTKVFTIDMVDNALFRINDYLKQTEIPFVFYMWITGEGIKRVHLYSDERYIRYDGVQLKDWNLIKYIKILLLIKKHPIEWKK